MSFTQNIVHPQNWRWQLENCVNSPEELKHIVHLSDAELNGVLGSSRQFKMRISPHIALLMSEEKNAKLRKQFLPSVNELDSVEDNLLYSDVNADNRYSPVKNLIHRYPSKILIFPANHCGSFCRYCFRRRLARDNETIISERNIEQIIKYEEENDKIEEIIFSGGDPLVLDDSSLDYIIRCLKDIAHIKLIRIHTRMPIVNPYRLTESLLRILKQFNPIFIVIHIDTLEEISQPMRKRIEKYIDSGILCFASTPLLKGINDDEDTLRALWSGLLQMRVKPYYLFHSDPVKGLRHFIVPIERGIQIMKNLYDNMSGLAFPHYCLNVPDGGGHILLNYNYIEKMEKGIYKINTFEGKQYNFIEKI